eukprot:4479281-Pyramimonas_sp.AAC.1
MAKVEEEEEEKEEKEDEDEDEKDEGLAWATACGEQHAIGRRRKPTSLTLAPLWVSSTPVYADGVYSSVLGSVIGS